MTDKQQPDKFDWATELSDAQGHVTLSAQEAKEIGARLRSMGAKLKTYEDLGDAADDMQLLRMGYAAARLEIESLRKEHADELAVAYMCGASREKELAAQQPGAAYAPLPECDATTVGLGEVWNRHSMRDFADATCALRASRGQAPAGDWLWVKLMSFCKKRGYAPAEYNDLFEIVKEARFAPQPSPAGMGDPLVTAAPAAVAGPSDPDHQTQMEPPAFVDGKCPMRIEP